MFKTWKHRLLSILALGIAFVGTAGVQPASLVLFYQPEEPEILREE